MKDLLVNLAGAVVFSIIGYSTLKYSRSSKVADSLIIKGKESLAGGAEVSAHNDHRIAMAMAIAATRCEKPVMIRGAECVRKSYPDFWEVYRSLGGIAEEI